MKLRILITLFLGVFISSQAWSANPFITCDQTYALCTSAKCLPSPDDPTKKAICRCDVQSGVSAGLMACDKRVPKKEEGVQLLISTFSLEQFKNKKVMTCAGVPWTDCMDMPCAVNPSNASEAICTCKIKQSNNFVTLGGGCNTGTCADGYFSGATQEAIGQAVDAMNKATGKKVSWTGNQCNLDKLP